jgi:hypothetical protein
MEKPTKAFIFLVYGIYSYKSFMLYTIFLRRKLQLEGIYQQFYTYLTNIKRRLLILLKFTVLHCILYCSC